MNNTQVDKSNEALHNWMLGDTHPLLEVMLELLPTELSEDGLLEILHFLGISIEGLDLDGLRLTWSNCMTPSGKWLLMQVVPALVCNDSCDLAEWIQVLRHYGCDLKIHDPGTLLTITTVRMCVQRYKCFFDPDELSCIAHCISVLASGQGDITERALLADMHAHGLEVRYMDLIRPLARRYAEEMDLDTMMGAMTFTHVNREPG